MRIKRLFAALLAVLCLSLPVQAEESTLAERMEVFMVEKGLHQGNFSVCYYNTVTKEEYRFNDSAMMVAASTYKLPLNMYYYEMEARGEIASDAYIPRAGASLEYCHEMSLLHSDNPTSIGLLYNLGNFRTYKDKMLTYFGMTPEEVPSLYYADNYYSTAMMMGALKHLYDHQESLSQMMSYLKQACPGAYFKKYITDCEIAHKYGSFEGAENDVGIIFANQPFLLAVYTQGVGENISARVAEIAKQYTDEQYEKAVAAEEAAKKAAEETPSPESVSPEPVPAEPEPVRTFPIWILPAVSIVCSITAVVLSLSNKKQKVKG